MKRLLLPLAVAALTACSSSSTPGDSGTPNDAGGTTDAGGQTVAVHATSSLTFSPATVTIHVGDTVQWTFDSAGHTVTSGSGCAADNKFCSPNDSSCSTGTTSASGSTYSHTFTTAGTFPYFCVTHCALNMTGTVTVQ